MSTARAQREPVVQPRVKSKGGCKDSDKLRFETKADALVKALQISSNPLVGAGAGGAYLCTFCGDWHLTSKPRRDVA